MLSNDHSYDDDCDVKEDDECEGKTDVFPFRSSRFSLEIPLLLLILMMCLPQMPPYFSPLSFADGSDLHTNTPSRLYSILCPQS